ncbi:TPA: hypothetical protein ACXHWU_002229 [Morganella morganii]
MLIECDFINDWYSLMRDLLVNHYKFNQSDVDAIQDDELPFKYIYLEERLVKKAKRKVYISNSFSCPSDIKPGWDGLKNKIENGEDLTPYLSKKISNLDYHDKMFNEWGIHHFHLGSRMIGGFIERTGCLLYALVTSDGVYAINIYQHDNWTRDSILQTIHDDWPNLIDKYKLNQGVMTHGVTPNERAILRKSNINSFFTASNGDIYMPTGGGSVASGYSTRTALIIIKTKKKIDSITKAICNLPDECKDNLLLRGCKKGEKVSAKLIITDVCYSVVFPKYSYQIDFT